MINKDGDWCKIIQVEVTSKCQRQRGAAKWHGPIINALMLWWSPAFQKVGEIVFSEDKVRRRCSLFQGVILRWEDDISNMSLKMLERWDCQSYLLRSARSRVFSAFIQTPGLVSVKPVYQRGIDLAAIAARSPFGTKAGVGIILHYCWWSWWPEVELEQEVEPLERL